MNKLIILIIIIGIGLINPYCPIYVNENCRGFSQPRIGIDDKKSMNFYYYSLVIDTRPYLNLTNVIRYEPQKPFRFGNAYERILELDKVDKDKLDDIVKNNKKFVSNFYGIYGFLCPNYVYIMGKSTLADPLRSRLPADAVKKGYWNPEDFARHEPAGYIESIFGENVIRDPDLHEYYDILKVVTRGDLLNWERIKLIWELNTGEYDFLIDNYCKRNGYEI